MSRDVRIIQDKTLERFQFHKMFQVLVTHSRIGKAKRLEQLKATDGLL